MTQTEMEERYRYYVFYLLLYPTILLVSIYFVGSVIKTLFHWDTDVPSLIFTGIGGVGYFTWYFKEHIIKIKNGLSKNK